MVFFDNHLVHNLALVPDDVGLIKYQSIIFCGPSNKIGINVGCSYIHVKIWKFG